LASLLTPVIEVAWRLRYDPAHLCCSYYRFGTGVSSSDLGIRLRYELRREIAPYVGISWSQQYGDTADLAKAAGRDSSSTALVAGLRFWF